MKKYNADILLKKAADYNNRASQLEKVALLPALLTIGPTAQLISEIGLVMFLGSMEAHAVDAIRDTYNDDLKENATILTNLLSELTKEYSNEEVIANNMGKLVETINALFNLNQANEDLGAIPKDKRTNVNTLPLCDKIIKNAEIFSRNYYDVYSAIKEFSKSWTTLSGLGYKSMKFLGALGLSLGFRSDLEKILHALPEMSAAAKQVIAKANSVKESINKSFKEELDKKELLNPDNKTAPDSKSDPSSEANIPLSQSDHDKLLQLSKFKETTVRKPSSTVLPNNFPSS